MVGVEPVAVSVHGYHGLSQGVPGRCGPAKVTAVIRFRKEGTHQQQSRFLPVLPVIRWSVVADCEHVHAVALVEVDTAKVVATLRGIVRATVGVLHVE
jgi:hypothetical protein